MTSNALLNNVSIVLVNTKTPGNIGASARCMMNMGLSRLILVRPPQDETGEALRLSAGAEEILEQASVFSSLQEAIAGHNLVIGTSRQRGKDRRNSGAMKERAGEVMPLLRSNRVAFVFGREVNGLGREDLALCHELAWIPSAEAFPSLNLSHAVMVLAYELSLAAGTQAAIPARELAPSAEIERFYEHLGETLRETGFIRDENEEHMMLSLRQLFGRARLDRREVQILRGILAGNRGVGREPAGS